MLDPNPLGLLERAGLRKAVLDAGFDVLTDGPNCVFDSSSHAPLSCVAGRLVNGGGYGAGMSMASAPLALGGPGDGVLLGVGDASGVYLGATTPMAEWRRVHNFAALERRLAQAWALSRVLPSELERRFERAVADVSHTEREATVRQRIGQDLFRQGLMPYGPCGGGRSAITGLELPELLRASHAKPWAARASLRLFGNSAGDPGPPLLNPQLFSVGAFFI